MHVKQTHFNYEQQTLLISDVFHMYKMQYEIVAGFTLIMNVSLQIISNIVEVLLTRCTNMGTVRKQRNFLFSTPARKSFLVALAFTRFRIDNYVSLAK